MSDIRVCQRDGEPLVFTLEFPGAEYVCVECNGTEDIFGARAEATEERQRRLDELTERYGRARAERTGQPYTPSAKIGDDGVTTPTCSGCGASPAEGLAVDRHGKPRAWFSRVRDGVTEYVCSTACIPTGEAVMPW